MLKARNLAQGCFSLSLDGLAQEAGALLRVMIETLELLTYLREDPNRIEEVFQQKLPSAGERAKRIGGRMHGLRNHLNEHASHFSFTPEALLHTLSPTDFTWKLSQPYNEMVLKTNLLNLFVFLAFLLIEAASCLSTCGALSNEVSDRVERLRHQGLAVFGIVQTTDRGDK